MMNAPKIAAVAYARRRVADAIASANDAVTKAMRTDEPSTAGMTSASFRSAAPTSVSSRTSPADRISWGMSRIVRTPMVSAIELGQGVVGPAERA